MHYSFPDCNIKCLLDTDNNFKALYFSTANMRKAMSAWPEIANIDGTYSLFNQKFTLFLIQVLSGTGRSEIVGAAIVGTEDSETLKFIAETFKEENLEACTRMKCIMSDKDMKERGAFKKVFGDGLTTYLCMFHVVNAFDRKLTALKLGKESKLRCNKLFKNAMYSSSEDQYNECYEALKQEAPEKEVKYFEKNWHPIKKEWTHYNMTEGNFGIQTNNALESTNKQIKTLCEKNSTLCRFADSFFAYIQSQNQETDLRRAHEGLRRKTVIATSETEILPYSSHVTSYAFKKIEAQFELRDRVRLLDINTESGVCKTDWHGHMSYECTITSCTCVFKTSVLLPCRHIFAVRKHFGAPVFDANLCSVRWNIMYDHSNMRTNEVEVNIDIDSSVDNFDDTNKPSSSSSSGHPITVQTPRRKPKTVRERRKEAKIYTDQLADALSLWTGPMYEEGINVIKKLASDSNQRHHQGPVSPLAEECDADALVAEVEDVHLSEAGNPIQALEVINMPTPLKMRGRPRGAFATTTGFFRRSSRQN